MRLERDPNVSQKLARRARMVLMAAEGHSNNAIAKALRTGPDAVSFWRTRFAQGGPDALRDLRPGRKPLLWAEMVERVVHTTIHEKPQDAPRWSIRTMAEHLGLSQNMVHRIWKTHGLQPRRVHEYRLPTMGAVMPRPSKFKIRLTAAERTTLKTLAQKYTSPYKDVIRARMILCAVEGLTNDQIAHRLDTSENIVNRWRKRFLKEGLDGLKDRPRRGGSARFSSQHGDRD